MKSIKQIIHCCVALVFITTMASEKIYASGQTSFLDNETTSMYFLRYLQSPSLLFPAQAELTTVGLMGAGSSSNTSASEAEEQAKLAEAMANPLSYLWMIFIQNDTSWWDGDILGRLNKGRRRQNTTLIMPVLSFQLTEEWKTIFRPVIPINSFNTLGNLNVSAGSPSGVTGVDFESETGLGDMVLWTAFSNKYEPPYVFGFGSTMMLDTASDEQLGTGKWSAGPMGMAMYIGEKWIIGGIAQHWWSFAGDNSMKINTSLGPLEVDRPDVNLTDLQYIIRYRLTPTTNIGAAPNIRYNWETDQLDLPIGIGGDTLIKIGQVPVKIGAEIHHYVERNENFGPEWMLRIFFVPIIPAPEWSRKPLF